MGGLSPEDQAKLERHRQRLDAMLDERLALLADFAERLGMPNGALVVADPESFLEPLSSFLQEVEIGEDPDDRIWLLTRLGYFIGELLISRHSGCWLVVDNPRSRNFLRIVVGQFQGRDRSVNVDPFEVARTLVDSKPAGGLKDVVGQIERELREMD